MKRKLFFFIGLTLFLTNCGYIATREDVEVTKEAVDKVEEDLNKKIQNIEKDLNLKIKETADKILTLTNEINSIKEEIKLIRGKIEELNYEYEEKIKKIGEEIDVKNLELKRDIEGLKKAYNDILTTTASVNKNLTLIQTDVINLKNSQTRILESFQEMPDRVNRIEEKLNSLEKKFDESTKILLEEIVRHESEIYRLKKEFYGKEKEVVKSILKDEKRNYYIVKKGDHLTKIAQRFNTTVEEIKKINNLKEDTVYPGQKLLIP
ncbi:MAG: LysM peptidoglycan-binding domain-containing protein [Candidatus Omnitrophica bacterium]|nr:LysM peptidoglycan-binding domain-containing protein [Candidatus Omnitrophota bacterium]